MFKAKIDVTLKDSVLDPSGQTILSALHSLGVGDAKDLRVGKHFLVTIDTSDRVVAEAKVKEMCEKLLVNPIIEKYFYEIEPLG